MTARIGVATATLFREPTTDRPLDAPALAPVTDVRKWVASLEPAERLRTAVVSQALLGEPAIVDSTVDGWSKVVLTGQPATDLDPRGYPGWLPSCQLAPSVAASAASLAASGLTDSSAGADLVVAVTATTLRDVPDGDLVLPAVVLGTRLRRAPLTGPGRSTTSASGWCAVDVPGHPEPLWARSLDLAPAPTTVTPREVLKTAAMLRETPYVWGGLSPFGIDCSGLVHLSWRRHGVTLPRDAYNQAAYTTPIPFGTERPGDLYFFARPGQRVHHVGFVASAPRGDTRIMLHACSEQREVVIEEVRGKRADTLVAAHRVPL
ncbi:cell wall-associated NlpC family hydrolase [Hamadaea flava]|uniref:NlpC/P60 family protein n=1 Tax=Hamadaea flava TaxID=1742688 RepID=A0ABV8LV40_9ACTN|nr:C40 family peptidase [Hamadaea flava]MCP2328070.1 cell wall-associated NlpC family hydrolase [Hamadaea flava]